MPLNLEIKIKLDSHEAALQILNSLRAEFVKDINQKDIYYKMHGCLLKLRIEDEGESLIKYNRDEVNLDRFSDYEVIYLKSSGSEKFFSSLFEVEAVVQKKRSLYLFDNTRIHLDSVKDLGTFLEFETLVINGMEDAKTRFSFLVGKFGLDTTKQLKCSYRDLIINK
jgi:adenylate cyclase, class 2